MVLKFYGVPQSVAVQRVLVVIKELGVDVDIVPVNFINGEVKLPEHVAKQPFGLIPVLVSVAHLIVDRLANCS